MHLGLGATWWSVCQQWHRGLQSSCHSHNVSIVHLVLCDEGHFLACKDLGEGQMNHSQPALFFFFWSEISSRSRKGNFTLYDRCAVNSSSSSWDDCGQGFLYELHVSSFSWYVPTLRHVQHSPLRLRGVKGACVGRRNQPPPYLADWPGFLVKCHCDNVGWSGHGLRVCTES